MSAVVLRAGDLAHSVMEGQAEDGMYLRVVLLLDPLHELAFGSRFGRREKQIQILHERGRWSTRFHESCLCIVIAHAVLADH